MSDYVERMIHNEYHTRKAEDGTFPIIYDVENPRVVVEGLTFDQACALLGEFSTLHGRFNFELLKQEWDNRP